MISFHLALTTWEVSAASKRAMFSTKTLFWNFFKYSSYFFFFFLPKSLLLILLSYLDLSNLSHFLSSSLNIVGLYCLFQIDLKSLLFFVSSLYFLALLFKYFGVSLINISWQRRKHNDIEKSQKFSSYLYIVDLSTIIDFSNKFNRTLKTQS